MMSFFKVKLNNLPRGKGKEKEASKKGGSPSNQRSHDGKDIK